MKTKFKSKRYVYVYRDAGSGRFVTSYFADRNRSTTTRNRIRRGARQ